MTYGYKSLQHYYEELADMVRYSDYSYSELRSMLPYELDVFASLTLIQKKKENEGNK